MKKILLLMIVIFSMSNGYAANQGGPFLEFNKLFTEWTQAFNNRKLTQTCGLFSTSLVSNYRGLSQMDYSSMCDGFKKIFSDSKHRYVYHFKLQDVYHAGNLAAIRITWYLDILRGEKLVSSTEDEGVDIFQKDRSGHWKIMNYLGFAKPMAYE